MVFEDAHWIDPTTLELLGPARSSACSACRCCVVITFRPEFVPALDRPAARHRADAQPARAGGEGAAMVERLTGGKALPAEVLRADRGEDRRRAAVRRGADQGGARDRACSRDEGDRYELAGPLPPLGDPGDAARLADGAARPARRSVKEVAQIGAAIGREFAHELLAAVAPAAGARAAGGARPARRGRARVPPRHAAGRRPTPSSTRSCRTRPTRACCAADGRELHARIAGALEEHFPETAETKPELLAHHWELAKDITKAVDYRLRAGHRASERSAAPEAIAQLHMGLQLLAGLPPSPERDRQELLLQLALFSVLVGVRGYAAPETGTALTRAGKLCGSAGDRSLIFPVLYGQRGFHFVRAELDAAHELNEEMLRLARESGDSAAQMTAHGLLGEVFCSRGDLVLGRAQLEKALALYDPEQHHPLTFLYGQSPRVTALCWLSWTLLFSGYPEQGLRRIGEAIADARHLSHFNTLAYALIFGSAVHYQRRDRQATQERSEALISLCTEQRLFFWLGAAHCLHGWALASGGHPEDGIAELNQGIAAYRATGGELFMPFLLAVHAETLQKTGHSGGDSLDLLSEAVSRASMTGERCYEAELHRLRGECVLSLASRNQTAAEASFQQSIEVARHQGGKMWELRGAASLARLWRRQGRRAEARDLLAPIYGWFTEGRDARDLTEARELLDQLQ